MSGIESLLRAADRALYSAKSAGKNCICAKAPQLNFRNVWALVNSAVAWDLHADVHEGRRELGDCLD